MGSIAKMIFTGKVGFNESIEGLGFHSSQVLGDLCYRYLRSRADQIKDE